MKHLNSLEAEATLAPFALPFALPLGAAPDTGSRAASRLRLKPRLTLAAALAAASLHAAAQSAPASATPAADGNAAPAQATAQTATQAAAPSAAAVALPATSVTATVDAPYKAETVSSSKYTAPLRDIPQSITVVPKKVLEEQNAQSLQDILKNVPGITFMSGEGNLGWGDLFSIRGFSAEQSITIDGVRDAGLSSRNDTFDLDRVEVYKGTGTIESGVAALGGSVNLVSKEAELGSFYRSSFGLGSDNYRRMTADLNQQLGDTTALRLNLMSHHNGVAGRDEVKNDRYGIAASLGLGLGTSTRVIFDVFHQKDNNVPDTGLPIQRGTGGQLMPGVQQSNWYGAAGIYTQQTESTSLSGRVEHDFNDTTRIRSQLRWQQTDNFSVLSPARFFAANANGSKTCTGARCATLGYTGIGPLSNIGGVNSYTDYGLTSAPYGILRGSNFGNSTRYQILDNQTDLRFSANTGPFKHDVVTGFELYRETYGGNPREAYVPAGDMFFNMANPSNAFAGKWSMEGTNQSSSTVNDAAIFASDTITLSPHWQVLASLRYDRWRAETNSPTGATLTSSTDGAWSGRAGLVYKPVEPGSIYVSYSRATQPTAIGASTNNLIYGTASTAKYDPATSQTYEMGTKWDLAGGALGFTAAVFRTELSNSWQYTSDDTSPVRALPAKRVDGVELGLQGNITDKWSIFAGVSRMKSRITKGANEGAEAANVPDWSGSIWTSYKVTPDLALSYGVQYVGHRRYTDNRYVGGLNNNSSNASGPSGVNPIYTQDNEKAPSYWVHNIAARYRVNRHVHVNLNLNNVFNKFYYAQIGASLDGFQLYGVPGAGRTVTVSADIAF
ncbi:TonB-dependent receptor [Pandoraea anhela]|uniref:TonB-dependent receptor n=1 Tax=Pandoraea anhela TaxID=2508295 RepID=A0A5E4RL63_9BURK|nr:TonB-dependent siderophore receptor [Pandoraea anhela]VVD62588.1 TonB-dependent receptor [Pandoraea anhela]